MHSDLLDWQKKGLRCVQPINTQEIWPIRSHISGRLANQIKGKLTNQKARYKQKQPIDTTETKNSFYKKQRQTETHTSFDMSRKSKSKDQTKASNMPFTLTQWDLVQEALAVAIVQTQALNIPIKVPLGSGRYAELSQWTWFMC